MFIKIQINWIDHLETCKIPTYVKKELERKRKLCFHRLLLPSKEIPTYPILPSVRTSPSELSQEWVNYYLDKQEELQEIQKNRYFVYLSLLAQATNEEEKEHIKEEGLKHEQQTDELLNKIKNGLRKKFGRQQMTPVEGAEARKGDSPENDYLELERTLSTPEVLEVTKQRLEEMIKDSSQTGMKTVSMQRRVVETISHNLQGMGMTRYEPGSESPKERRIKYTKEIGRNGGIERPTSTEARKSQRSAIQTAREFFNGSSAKPKRSGEETPIGEPQQDLDWDGLQESIGKVTPPGREQRSQPVTIKSSNKTATEVKSTESSIRTPKAQREGKSRKESQVKRSGVSTMPRPPYTRSYKRKRGDPTGKIYVDVGMYGDEKDDTYAKGECGSELDVALFELVCERCRGDHIRLYCPYNSEGNLKQKIPKRNHDPSSRPVNYTVSTPCWNCEGNHYYRDCPEKEWHGQLERARDQSEELHLSLMYNSKGYARLHHLNQEQIKTIKESQLAPEPRNSTKTPYIDLGRDIEAIPEKEFKIPPPGMRPPRRIQTPTTPKFDLDPTSNIRPTAQGTQQWVREQNEIKHKTRYILSQESSTKLDGVPLVGERKDTQPPRRRERTPRKQLFPRKLDKEAEKISTSVRAIGSQVQVESLEELQEQGIILSPAQRLTEGKKETTLQYPSKPDHYAHTPPRISQGTPIRPTQPEVIYKRESRRTTRYPPDQNSKVKRENGIRKSHPLLVQELERPLTPKASLKSEHYTTDRGCYACGREGHYATKEEKNKVIKGIITAEGGGRKQKAQVPRQRKHGQQSDQKGDNPQERPPPWQPRQNQGAGGGGGGDDPSDPNDSDYTNTTDDQNEEGEETETETEMEEEEIPQNELPKILKGHKVHRVRVPSKLLGPTIQTRSKSHGHGGGGGNSPSPSPPPDGRHPSRRKGKPKKRKPTWVYMVQGPPGLPGKDGRDGKDGANAPPILAPRQTIGGTANLDTTALEQSFDRVGQNIVNVLTEQRITNQKLEQQLNLNNDSLQEQADAMRDLADNSAKRAYDHMFAAIPIFDGTKPEMFSDWLESIETLCEESGRDIRTEVMGRSGPIIQRILKSIPADKKWSIQREELRRCVSDIPTKAHAAKKLQTLKQDPKENLRAFIHRFTTLHYITTNRTPEQENDVTHIVQFLSAIRNSKISKRIAEQRIPDGMTLHELFMKALDFEAGFQMSEGVTQKRESEIMEIAENAPQVNDVNEMGPRKGTPNRSCYACGGKGHYFKDCPGKKDDKNIPYEEGVVGQMQHTLTTTSDITNKMMGELYKQLVAAELKSQLYRRGYKRVKASTTQTSVTTTPSMVTTAAALPPAIQNPPVTATVPATTGPNMNPVVQLTRVKTTPNPTTSYATVQRTINIPRGITNAKAYFASKAPATATAGTATTTTVTSTRTSKGGPTSRNDKRTRNGPTTKIKKTDACQALETIPEEQIEQKAEPLINLDVSDSEAEDLCEILEDIPTETEDEVENLEAEPEF